MPEAQGRQEAGGDRKVPAGHEEAHNSAPWGLFVPAAQSVHAFMDVLRKLGLNLPAVQSVHEEDWALLHLPAGQSISPVPPGQYVPAAHSFWLHVDPPKQQSEQV